jgi:type IV pilus assembly protein PilQ
MSVYSPPKLAFLQLALLALSLGYCVGCSQPATNQASAITGTLTPQPEIEVAALEKSPFTDSSNNTGASRQTPAIANKKLAFQSLPPVEYGRVDFAGASPASNTIIKQSAFFQNAADADAPPVPPEVEIIPAPPGVPEVPRTDRVHVPLNSSGLPPDAKIETNGELVSLSVREAPLHAVITLLAQQQGLSIVASSSTKTPITVTLQPMRVEEALNAVLHVAGCTWFQRGNVIFVSEVNKTSVTGPFVQGRVVRVFTLNYVSATDVEKVVTGLISPLGKVFIRQVDAKDRLRTQEQVVVEDLPEYVERAAMYVSEVDQPPRQVLVEARLLQVKLRNELLHGVNLQALAQAAGANIDFSTKGFATSTGPGMVFSIDGTDLNTVVNALETNADAKTLANPKLLVLNGQSSRIQIGKRLGYFVTTTTQTSTLQDVQFLEVGVVLDVTPTIANDGHILLKVKPEVSNGIINPTTTLPEEETTEVETTALLPNGHGIIIGGLIQETDIENQNKLPFLGDLWLIGRLFQRRSVQRERSEVIVVLVPRIVPYDDCYAEQEQVEFERSFTPLLTPELQKTARPWEPQLHDAMNKPKHLFK